MALVVALGLALAAEPAAAHSELRATVPANGARLAASPPALELTFNEDVQLTALRLLDAADKPIRLERKAAREPRRAERATVPSLTPGAYRVLWAAISADGHPITGSFRFEVADATGAPAAESAGQRKADGR